MLFSGGQTTENIFNNYKLLKFKSEVSRQLKDNPIEQFDKESEWDTHKIWVKYVMQLWNHTLLTNQES